MKLLPIALILGIAAIGCSSGLSDEEVRALVDRRVSVAFSVRFPDGVIVASEVRLVDQPGWLRASLFTDQNEAAGLQVFDTEGTSRIQIFASSGDGTTGLSLADQADVERASLVLGDIGEPLLMYFDQRGTVRSRLQLSPNGFPGLFFHDVTGRNRSRFAQEPTGDGIIGFLDPRGVFELAIPER